MTSPVPPVPESGAPVPVALSPTKKILLAGSIIALGLAAAGFHLRRPVETLINKAVDPVLDAAPLPNIPRAETPAPTPPSAPDTGTEKYSQAYPPPILVADESLVKEPPKTDNISKKSEKPEKPVVVKRSEFKPVHPLSKPVPALVKADRSSFKPIPKAKSSTHTLDELLPLFDFAENLQPLTVGDVAPVQPSNPFQTIGDLTPLRPLRSALVPLTPGNASQGEAAN